MNILDVIKKLESLKGDYNPHEVADWLTEAFNTEVNTKKQVPSGEFAGTTLLWWALTVSAANAEPLDIIRTYCQTRMLSQQQEFKLEAQKQNEFVIHHYEIGNITLTIKESVTFYYLLRGFTAKQIGLKFFRSKRTVEKHILHIRQKLGVKSKSEIVEIAIKLNLYIYTPAVLMEMVV